MSFRYLKHLTKTAVVGVLVCGFSSGLFAEELNYNLYQLQATATGDIANDLMVVTMISTHQAVRAQEASEEVNKDMEWALAEVRGEPAVNSRTERYSTSPQYRSEKITGWTVSQNLRLESDDFDVLTEMVGDLQDRLQVQSMTFGVKPQTRTLFENQLIAEVLEAYRQRAEIVVSSMQADGYEMVNTSINTQNSYSPVYARAEMSMMSRAASDSAPSVEAGESKVTVTVNGQIQLEF